MNLSVLAATLVVAVAGVAAGCSGDASTTPSPPAASSENAAGATVPRAAESLLAEHGLDGMDTVEIVDHLDRLGGEERPADLIASVRPGEVLLSGQGEEHTLPIPDDRFYLSIAPYVDRTHECFHHSLTTCTGELAGEKVHVTITDTADGTVLVDETRTTFANGFVGFWLPRGIDAEVEVHRGEERASAAISTDEESPTCLTTLQLT